MFDINTLLLDKMGWQKYYKSCNPPGLSMPIFNEDDMLRFFLNDSKDKIYYFIKELTVKEKQKSINLYKFLVMDYKDMVFDKWKPKFKITEFNSNLEMLTLIIKFNACNENYKRHFKINKILK